MMRRILVLTLCLAASACWADQISVSYAFGGTNSVDASLSGVALGPALNLDVTDKNTGQIIPLSGVSASSTGRSTSFVVLTSPNLVLANYGAGSANSVVVTDGHGNILIAGTMEARGSLVSTYPGGTGAFLGDFIVTDVSASLLAMFHLPDAWLPDGSVSSTFGEANLTGTDHLQATVGGGSVTIQTPTPTPEVATCLLYGTGLLICMAGIRRFNKENPHA